MKLCMVVTDAVSFNVLYRGQLEYLAEHGFNLTLICGGSAVEINKLRGRNVGSVIDVGLVREPRMLRDVFSLLRLCLHFLTHRYELVVSTTPKALLIASIAACIARQPRRVAFFQGRVYENFSGRRRWFYCLLDRWAVACVNEVLFVSRSLMTEIGKDIPASAEKGGVLASGSGNGVCLQKFSRDAVSNEELTVLRTELGIQSGDFVVLIVGRVCEDKGIAEIADVVQRMSSLDRAVKFVFVGAVEGVYATERLESLVKAGLAIHVRFTADVVPYFGLADVHLFLTRREGFGNVAIEAAAMGVPTIAFDVVGVRDSVAEGTTGHRLHAGDIESIVKLLRAWGHDRESTKRLFPEARAWVVQEFAQGYVWENYAKFYLSGRD